MAAVTVEFHPTPNPNAGKFVVRGSPVSEGGRSRSFFRPEDAADVPVARALLALPGVASVFMVADFITVTKTPEADWRALVPEVERTIRATL